MNARDHGHGPRRSGVRCPCPCPYLRLCLTVALASGLGCSDYDPPTWPRPTLVTESDLGNRLSIRRVVWTGQETVLATSAEGFYEATFLDHEMQSLPVVAYTRSAFARLDARTNRVILLDARTDPSNQVLDASILSLDLATGDTQAIDADDFSSADIVPLATGGFLASLSSPPYRLQLISPDGTQLDEVELPAGTLLGPARLSTDGRRAFRRSYLFGSDSVTVQLLEFETTATSIHVVAEYSSVTSGRYATLDIAPNDGRVLLRDHTPPRLAALDVASGGVEEIIEFDAFDPVFAFWKRDDQMILRGDDEVRELRLVDGTWTQSTVSVPPDVDVSMLSIVRGSDAYAWMTRKYLRNTVEVLLDDRGAARIAREWTHDNSSVFDMTEAPDGHAVAVLSSNAVTILGDGAARQIEIPRYAESLMWLDTGLLVLRISSGQLIATRLFEDGAPSEVAFELELPPGLYSPAMFPDRDAREIAIAFSNDSAVVPHVVLWIDVDTGLVTHRAESSFWCVRVLPRSNPLHDLWGPTLLLVTDVGYALSRSPFHETVGVSIGLPTGLWFASRTPSLVAANPIRFWPIAEERGP